MTARSLIGVLVLVLLAVGLGSCGSGDDAKSERPAAVQAPSPGAKADAGNSGARATSVRDTGDSGHAGHGGDVARRTGPAPQTRSRPSGDDRRADGRSPRGPESAPAAARRSAPQTERLALDAPRRGHPLVRVRKGQSVAIRTEPGGGEVVERARKRTEFGSPTVFGVVRREGGWVAVTTADLPNGRLGWIRLDPRRLAAGATRMSVVVDVSERRAVLFEADRPRRSFPVTVGMPGSATPTGRFAVTDTFRGNLHPAYGCCAVAISATQPSLPSGWLGGNRIAIHGTSGPLGVAASHGCVRVADADVSALIKRVPLGAPVLIRA